MFEQIPSYFQINISFFVLLVVGLLSGLLAYYQYRQTVPPISTSLRIVLGILRGSAFACILLLIFAPEFTAIWQKTSSARLVLLIDKSASMGLIEGNQNRLIRSLQIARDLINKTNNQIETVIYGFDTDTSRFENLSMDTSRLGTNIDNSLRAIIKTEKNAKDMVLITDGNFSIGDNPLYSDYLNQINLFSIGIGDTLEIPDLMITEVKNNKIVYQNQPTQVQVYVMSRGIKTQRLSLSMKQRNRTILARDLQINGEGKVQMVEFEIIPDKVGLNQFDFHLQNSPGEVITQNNHFTISMEVLKGKIEVGLFASKPDYDTKFLDLLLSDLEDINLHSSVLMNRGKYYPENPGKFVDSLDVSILYNYPPLDRTDSRADQIVNRLKSMRNPALIILNENINEKRLVSLRDFIPVKSIQYSPQAEETQIKASVERETVPFLNIFEDDEKEIKFWNMCPPIQYPYSKILFDSPPKILLQTDNRLNNKISGQPVLITSELKGKKSALLLGSGFWRWHFLFAEDKEYQNSWQLMLKNLIRWLDTGSVNKNVVLSAGKNTYQVGDDIVLNTQVYDGSFKSVNDGLIRTAVVGPETSFEIESKLFDNGRYEGSFVPLTPGKYHIKSKAWRNNIELGEDDLELIVTTINREFLTTKQNYRFLKRLAEKSGGRYFNEKNAMGLINYLNLKPEIKRVSETVELWNRLPFLLIIIFLLCLEWIIRKRKDLA